MWLRLQFVSTAVVAAVLAYPASALPMSLAKGAVARAGAGVQPTAAGAPARCRRGQGPCRAGLGGSSRGYYAPIARTAPAAPSDYYVRDANKLPFGSERWRDQMRRENRLGNPG
jgi:hypothetical protein